MESQQVVNQINEWREKLSSIMTSLKSNQIPSKYIQQSYDSMLTARFYLGEVLKILHGRSIYTEGDSLDTVKTDRSLNKEDYIPWTDGCSADDLNVLQLKQLRADIQTLQQGIINAPTKKDGRINIMENQASLELIKARGFLGMVFTELNAIREQLESQKTIGVDVPKVEDGMLDQIPSNTDGNGKLKQVDENEPKFKVTLEPEQSIGSSYSIVDKDKKE